MKFIDLSLANFVCFYAGRLIAINKCIVISRCRKHVSSNSQVKSYANGLYKPLPLRKFKKKHTSSISTSATNLIHVSYIGLFRSALHIIQILLCRITHIFAQSTIIANQVLAARKNNNIPYKSVHVVQHYIEFYTIISFPQIRVNSQQTSNY